MRNREPRPLWERPGAMVAAVAVMLAVGLALGVGIGSGLRTPPPAPPPPLVIQAIPPAPPPVVVDEPPPPPQVEPEPEPVPPPAPVEEAPPAPAPVEPPPVSLPPPPPQPPQPQVAMLPPPRPPAPPAGTAPWLRHAVPAPHVGGRPMVVVIIDDLGVDRRRAEQVVRMPGPLTLSFMTYATDLARLTGEARRHGHELMVHVPMQPMATAIDAGPQALTVGLSAEEIRRRLDWALSRFDGYIGINNHMGSRFTADPAAMAVVMAELRRRGLAFVDSVTTDRSVAAKLAREYGVPVASRDIFLDNDQSVALVQAQLAKVEARARRTGFAIAIGHPHDATIAALNGWLPTLAGKGLVLVPVSTLIRDNRPAR
ncbi:divergent polysaccharide deacetylase family protein [Phaeospirillum tilakii]|uniref:Divergent polysaccharide deacetylase family protein n=1 Tax=Phaeospirillum tilakii TaxID=741673 RepID=A0ABW5C9Q4_9PROT